MEATDRVGVAAMVQKQMEQMEHSSDERDRASMVLVDSFIGDEGAAVVTEALRNNYTVRSLDMRGCNIRADGAVALAELVENNVHLQSLGLEWNSIGMSESGLQRLCQALVRNSSLTELDLRNNGISTTGGVALGEMLAKNTSLKRIDLRWNSLGASGGRAILDGMQHNSSVIELTLAGNKVADETLRSIEHLLHKNRGHVVEYISDSVLLDGDRSSISIYGRHALSPGGSKSAVGSPSRRLSPIPNGSLQVDVHSSERKSKAYASHDSDMSRLLNQSTHLRNSVSGEVLEQNFREKLADLSRALVSEKEANVSLERRYCEEIEYRGSLEAKLLEYERLLRAAEESLLSEKARSEMREDELTSDLEKERGYRHVSDQQLISTKVELSELTKEHQEHTRETSRKISELNSEVSRHSHECSVLKKEMEEHKVAADRRQQRLLDDLRQTEDQREHLNKVYHSSVAKVSDLESELSNVRHDLNAQIKTLKEKIEKEKADRIHLEEAHQREVRTLNDRITSLGDSLQGEQEVLSKTKDDLNSTALARDRLQARLNHLMDEATEMRKEMSVKRSEFEAKLEAENDQRERIEAQLSDKTSQCEQLSGDLSQARHKISNLNGAIERLEQQGKNRQHAHEEKVRELMQETNEVREHHDRYKENMEKRISALEMQLVSKDHEISKLKEEEARRIVTLEDRLLQTMRAEIARASPPSKKGAPV